MDKDGLAFLGGVLFVFGAGIAVGLFIGWLVF